MNYVEEAPKLDDVVDAGESTPPSPYTRPAFQMKLNSRPRQKCRGPMCREESFRGQSAAHFDLSKLSLHTVPESDCNGCEKATRKMLNRVYQTNVHVGLQMSRCSWTQRLLCIWWAPAWISSRMQCGRSSYFKTPTRRVRVAAGRALMFDSSTHSHKIHSPKGV